MLKELKYLMYLIVIFFSIFFSLKYYLSDEYKKKIFRSLDMMEDNIKKKSINIILLENDTKNIIQFVENDNFNKDKKYHFWNLINNDEK